LPCTPACWSPRATRCPPRSSNDSVCCARRPSKPSPICATITLTTFDLDEYVYDALAAGADGFLLKDTDPAEILRAVHLVAAGSAMLHPTAARRLIDRYHATKQPQVTAAQARLERLTPRERDVLALLAQGDTNADIAARLAMRERTVKAHVSRILTALEVTNRVQAALVARDAGLTT
jgi:DNA-binding NarL/FixJ family response regulator